MAVTPTTGNVKIRFEGLMLGRFHQDTSIYEMGVLQTKGHKFDICCQIVTGEKPEKQPIHVLPKDGVWHLGIVNAKGEIAAADTALFNSKKPFDRLGDDSDNRADFAWVLDVESRSDFPRHPRPLGLSKPLKPVIEIRNGLLFNRQNSVSLHQQTRKESHQQIAVPFGKASKVLGLNMEVPPGNLIVLWKADPTDYSFQLPVQSGKRIEIFITNVDDGSGAPDDRRADFFRYYEVLNVTDDNQQYELWNLKPPVQGLAKTAVEPAPAADGCVGGSGAPGPLCGTAHLSQFTDSFTAVKPLRRARRTKD